MAIKGLEDLLRMLEAPDFDAPPVMALAGGEDFLRHDAAARLRQRLAGDGYEVERFDHRNGTAEALLSRLRSSSMFGGKSAVVLVNSRESGGKEALVAFKDQLLDYLERPSRDNVLVIVGDSWNAASPVAKKIKLHHLHVDCPEFKPWQNAEQERWIGILAARHGLRLERGVPAALRDASGGSLGIVFQELGKLALVVDGRAVTMEDLEQHLNFRGREDAFGFVDAVMEGDVHRAVDLAFTITREGDPSSVLPMLGLLETSIRKYARLHGLLAGEPQTAVALGKAGFAPNSPKVQQYIAVARAFQLPQQIKVYRLLLDADLDLKSGAPDAAALLQALVLKLASIFAQFKPAPGAAGARRSPAPRR